MWGGRLPLPLLSMQKNQNLTGHEGQHLASPFSFLPAAGDKCPCWGCTMQTVRTGYHLSQAVLAALTRVCCRGGEGRLLEMVSGAGGAGG